MDVKDWILSGGGMEGESYFSESHPDLFMKVYTLVSSKSYLENEFRLTQDLLSLGVSIPKELEITEFNGYPAIISQRIRNKKSFCRLAGEKPEMISNLANRMAAMVKDLHSKSVSDYSFESAFEKYQSLLNTNTLLDSKTKNAIQDALNEISADDRKTLLHGDMHFGNIITDGKNDYFIDLGDICYGNPNLDLATFYIATHFGCEHSFDFLYHLSWKQALDFWEEFKLCYYGREITDEEVFSELRNYMLARAIWYKHEQIQTSLCSILLSPDRHLTYEIKLKVLGE